MSIIDFFIVRRALRPGVVDVRVVRGVELGSDHHLVLMKVRLKVKKQKKGREVEWKTRWSDDFRWMYNCGMYLTIIQ